MTEHEEELIIFQEEEGHRRANAGANPPVKLYIQWSDEDEDWSVDTSPSANPKRKFKPILFEPGSGGADITFELRPPNGQKWTFSGDAESAISTEDNCDCPPSNGLNSDQLINPRFKNQGQPNEDRAILIVTNQNNDEARLVRYQLHISGAPLTECDPAILNGGKGTS